MSGKKKHVSIDIETLSSSSNAAILSVGAYAINGIEDEPDPERSFYVNIDVGSCMDVGLGVSASTFYWWLEQSDWARKRITENRLPLRGALDELQLWYKHVAKGDRIWAHSTFDHPILHNAYGAINMPIPWHYRDCRDLRTIGDHRLFLLGDDLKHGHSKEHDALWDAFAQGQEVAQYLDRNVPAKTG